VINSHPHPHNNPDPHLSCRRSTTRASISLTIATNRVQNIFFTFSFFPNASMTASVSASGHCSCKRQTTLYPGRPIHYAWKRSLSSHSCIFCYSLPSSSSFPEISPNLKVGFSASGLSSFVFLPSSTCTGKTRHCLKNGTSNPVRVTRNAGTGMLSTAS